MKRFQVILFGMTCLAAGLVAVAICRREREPEYQGKKLSEWLAMYAELHPEEPEATARNRQEQAANAIRNIGTKGLPFIMKWVFYEPSAWKRKWLSFLERTTYGSKIRHRIYPGRHEELRNLALDGFSVLGKDAAPVIPEIARTMNALNSMGDWPMLILRCLGDAGLASLMEVITNRANTVAFRACALKYVEWECTNSAWAVAPLVKCLQEEDWEIVSGAARAVGSLAQEPNVAVPALEPCLGHTNNVVRHNSLYALGRFAESAHSAAPSIMEMLVDRDIYARRGATNALRRIAPELLPRTGAKTIE